MRTGRVVRHRNPFSPSRHLGLCFSFSPLRFVSSSLPPFSGLSLSCLAFHLHFLPIFLPLSTSSFLLTASLVFLPSILNCSSSYPFLFLLFPSLLLSLTSMSSLFPLLSSPFLFPLSSVSLPCSPSHVPCFSSSFCISSFLPSLYSALYLPTFLFLLLL